MGARARQERREGVLEPCNNRKDFGSWKGGRGSKRDSSLSSCCNIARLYRAEGQNTTCYLNSLFLQLSSFCMQRQHSFSSLKGLQIENGNSAMMCCAWVIHNAAKHNYDGSSAILWSKCLSVHMFNLDSGACRWERKVCFWNILILCLFAQKMSRPSSMCFDKYLLKILIEKNDISEDSDSHGSM